MSWDVYICDGGQFSNGEGCLTVDLLDASYTYNVSPMLYEVFDFDNGLRGLHHMECSMAARHLGASIRKMQDDPDKFRAMNPENGWGNYEGAIRFLEKILEACIEAPKASVCIQ